MALGTAREARLEPHHHADYDFGISDPYVAAVKGATLNTNPDAAIIDVSHSIKPQAVEQAAFLLSCALPYFRRGSIHVVVVDPGVGTQRRGLALSKY